MYSRFFPSGNGIAFPSKVFQLSGAGIIEWIEMLSPGRIIKGIGEVGKICYN
jgi:hypothetical protein